MRGYTSGLEAAEPFAIQPGVRPRPDQVAPVFGSRYFAADVFAPTADFAPRFESCFEPEKLQLTGWRLSWAGLAVCVGQ